MGPLVYECPPLNAKLTHRACLLNRHRAKRALHAQRRISYDSRSSITMEIITCRVMLKCCLTCKGVKSLSKNGKTPSPVRFDRTLELNV